MDCDKWEEIMSYLKLAACAVIAVLAVKETALAQTTPQDCAGLIGTTILAQDIGMKTTGAKVMDAETRATSGEGAGSLPRIGGHSPGRPRSARHPVQSCAADGLE